ncbi:MAG: gluconeogenesis factor YvcK family protein [Defluviitoga tunisiensis]|jgi:uncharacterized cofD-like protein|nr:YvcK family protein [Defluviitoga tunisiensis]HOP24963.1 YvcK family protein [Defluviitoga sp.]MDY0379267.1 YvcK family protein [Defluviitoga tunisiensis]HHV02256.1 YvcK family protein [Defluviitoga tunisiensis]HOB55310.1 YvcK family protein [Defluviitoga tunisiensis]
MKNIVTIGGGTGLSQILRGLKWYKDIDVVSIVTVTDDGGSSGAIRNDFEIPPPGDIRNNILALAEKESLLTKLLDYRFNEGFLKNHNLGNIILLALTRMNNNNFPLAIKTLSEALKIKGRVYPSSLDLIRLAAEFEDGEISFGETCIVSKNKRIKRIWLDGNAEAFEESVLAIKNADLIVLGPGSLYTSIIPNILVDGIRNAINTNHNKKVYVANIMTQPGETTGYTLKDHVNEIENYLGQRLDYIIANSSNLPIQVIDRYKEMGATQVLIDIDGDQRLIKSDLVYIINQERPIVRHDPKKISELIVKCIN